MSNKKDSSVDNNTSLAIQDNKPGLLGELWQQARLVYRLFLDPEVPFYIKLLPVAAAAYLVFPFDFLPDVIPGFGQLDDITILIVGAKMFIELAPQNVVQRYLKEMQSNIYSSQPKDNVSQDKMESTDQEIIDGVIIDEEITKNEF